MCRLDLLCGSDLRRLAALLAVWASVLWGSGCNPDPYPGEQGDVLHVALRLLPKSFDPPSVEEAGSGQVASHIYEGLLQYHPYARPYQLMPALAEQLPTFSDDGLTVTFRMREGVHFADDPCFEGGVGREVTAYDLLYAIMRFAHPDTHTKGWWLLDDRIVGLDAWREDLTAELADRRAAGESPPPLWGLDRPIAGLTVLDRYTFQFELTAPYPQFLWVLAMPYTSIYPHEAVETYGEDFRNHPVGTGPFVLEEYNPVYRAVYSVNDNYLARDVRVPDPANNPDERYPGWQSDLKAGVLANAGERVPLVDGMEIRFILEDQPRWLYFSNGYVDALNPPKDNVKEAIPGGTLSPTMEQRGVKLTQQTELGTVYTCLNTEDALLSNVDVRRALALAIDHRWTVDNLYGGQALVAASPIPPGVAGYDADVHPFHADDGHSQLERAKEHLARAGFPGGVDPETGRALRLTYEASGSSVTNRLFASRFSDEVRRLGIEVDVVVNTFPQMIDKMRKGQFQVANLSWGFDYPDAQNILQLLYGPNKSPGIGSARFDDPAFNALYDEASTLVDGPERTALYEAMAAIIGEQVPWITRVHRMRPNLHHDWVSGYKYTEVNYQWWRYLAVDGQARKRALATWNQPVIWPCATAVFGVLALIGFTLWRGRPAPRRSR